MNMNTPGDAKDIMSGIGSGTEGGNAVQPDQPGRQGVIKVVSSSSLWQADIAGPICYRNLHVDLKNLKESAQQA